MQLDVITVWGQVAAPGSQHLWVQCELTAGRRSCDKSADALSTEAGEFVTPVDLIVEKRRKLTRYLVSFFRGQDVINNDGTISLEYRIDFVDTTRCRQVFNLCHHDLLLSFQT